MSRKAVLDLDLAYKLVDLGSGLPFEVVSGKTVCTNDFYEGMNDTPLRNNVAISIKFYLFPNLNLIRQRVHR